jgi:hypothetical protein
MQIAVAARCYNNVGFVERFLRCYDFADQLIISDGGSKDGSVEALEEKEKVKLIHFTEKETINGETWNPDNSHMNFVINAAKELEPDWLILDDFDCVPNYFLRENARDFLEYSFAKQVNVFRLYMWGDREYFPYMNRSFDINYTSLWAWKPKEIDIRADERFHHGTLIGLDPEPLRLDVPACLLHKSWNPDTIDAKVRRYNKLGITMEHPLIFAGKPEPLPIWAKE